MEVLFNRSQRTSANALKLAGLTEIKLYLVFRIKSSPREELRQSTVYSFYKTLQMVYQLETKQQLKKHTNDAINGVSKPFLKVCPGMHADQAPVYQNCLDTQAQAHSWEQGQTDMLGYRPLQFP